MATEISTQAANQLSFAVGMMLTGPSGQRLESQLCGLCPSLLILSSLYDVQTMLGHSE